MKKCIVGLAGVAAIFSSSIVFAVDIGRATIGSPLTLISTDKTQVVKLKTPDGKVINATVNAKDVKNLKKGDKVEFLNYRELMVTE